MEVVTREKKEKSKIRNRMAETTCTFASRSETSLVARATNVRQRTCAKKDNPSGKMSPKR